MVRALTRLGAPVVLFFMGSQALYAQVLTAPVPGQQIGGGPGPVLLFNPGSNNLRNTPGPGIGRIKSDLPTMGKTPGINLPPGVGFVKGVGVMPTLPQSVIPLENSAPVLQDLPQFEEYSIKPAPMENAGNRKDLPPTAGPSETSRALALKAEALSKPIQNAVDLSGASGEAAVGLGRKVIDIMMDGIGSPRKDSNLRPDANFKDGHYSWADAAGRLTASAARSGAESDGRAVKAAFSSAKSEYQNQISRSPAIKRGRFDAAAESDPVTLAGGVALIVMEVSRERLSLSHVAPRTSSQGRFASEGSFSAADEGLETGVKTPLETAPEPQDYSALTLQAFNRAGRGADSSVGRALVEDFTAETLPLLKAGFAAAPRASVQMGSGRAFGLAQDQLPASVKYGLPLLLWPFFPLLSLAFERPRR